jgi:hypothetical protein
LHQPIAQKGLRNNKDNFVVYGKKFRNEFHTEFVAVKLSIKS